MDLKDILSISGQSGLYKFVSQGRNGIIVESMEDQKRIIAHATAKVSALEDIAIFTDDKEVPLADVFKAIFEKENSKEAINHKSPGGELKKYFAEVLPDYDKERVYTSDIKKVILWYNLLHKYEMLDFSEDKKTEDEENAKEDKVVEENTPKETTDKKEK